MAIIKTTILGSELQNKRSHGLLSSIVTSCRVGQTSKRIHQLTNNTESARLYKLSKINAMNSNTYRNTK